MFDDTENKLVHALLLDFPDSDSVSMFRETSPHTKIFR